MNKKLILLVLSIMVGAVLFCVWRYFDKKSDIISNLDENFDVFEIKRIYEPDVNFTWEMSQKVFHPVRTLSSEENTATTNHYTAPPEIILIPEKWGAWNYNFIDRYSDYAHWPPLREVGVPVGSLEIRVWISTENTFYAFRICRHQQQWTGYYTSLLFANAMLVPDGDTWKIERDYTINPRYLLLFELKPQTSWKNLWGKVEKMGILTLPDPSTLPYKTESFYGFIYTVEINDGEQYRVYKYIDPENHDWPEAKKFNQIMNIFRQEFHQSVPREWQSWF